MNSKTADRIATTIIVLCAVIMVGALVFLLGYILINGLQHVTFHFLTTQASSFQAGGGIKDQLWNSFYVLIVTMIISVPLGVAGGIYLAEYAKSGPLTSIIRTSVEVLSSLPSIVVGMFGLLVFVNLTHWGYSIIGGALALTVFNLPVLVRVSEDALRAVEREQKEASLALGITHWYTIRTVLVPAAFPGILTGIILAAGRVFGEAAALLFTAGLSTPNLDFTNWNPLAMNSPLNLFRSAETLSVHIWAVNSMGIMPDKHDVAYGASAVLVICVLIFNLAARWLGSVIHKRMTGTTKR